MEKITFEDIKKANEAIQTTNIKGKEYAEVNQRIKAFRMVYPQGTISTDIVSVENGVVIMKTTILNEIGEVLATGTAYEKEDSTFINKTSYIENCETSAVGRALGMAGFGIDTSVASAEEVQNAITQQEADKQITETEAKGLLAFIKKRSETEGGKTVSDEAINQKLKQSFGVDSVFELKASQYAKILRSYKDK